MASASGGGTRARLVGRRNLFLSVVDFSSFSFPFVSCGALLVLLLKREKRKVAVSGLMERTGDSWSAGHAQVLITRKCMSPKKAG